MNVVMLRLPKHIGNKPWKAWIAGTRLPSSCANPSNWRIQRFLVSRRSPAKHKIDPPPFQTRGAHMNHSHKVNLVGAVHATCIALALGAV